MSDLLPPNATSAERALSLAIERHAALPAPLRDVWDAETCPAQLLAWLAWALTVDEWDGAWTDAQKRAVIKASLNVHRFKGTIGAVREALGTLASTARVQEWFAQIPAGDTYTFRVLLEVDQVGIAQADMASLQTVIERTKNLRSHLSDLQLIATTQAGPTVACCASVGSEIVVPASEYQIAQITPGFAAADDLLDQITNTDLPNSLGL